MANDPLAQLHDIHLPPPVPLWPPAPGWWLLAAALLILLLAGLWLWQRWKARATLRAALAEARTNLRQYQHDSDPRTLAARQNALLRRYALTRFPARELAALHGRAWLEFLDRQGPGGFAKGPGKALENAPYQPQSELDPEALTRLVEAWIRHNSGRRPHV